MPPQTPVEPTQVKYITERRQMPAHYWATLNAPCPLTIETSLEKIKNVPTEEIVAAFEKRACGLLRTASEALSSISGWSGAATSTADKQYQKLASPSSRVCSSLLSEMLRPSPAAEQPMSPATTHGELVSDHGSASTRSTPPLIASPPKRQSTISFGPAPVRAGSNVSSSRPTPQASAQPSRQASGSEWSTVEAPTLPRRHISFGGVTKTSPVKPTTRESDRSASDASDEVEKTPVAARRITFAVEQPAGTKTADTATEDTETTGPATVTRSRSIKFAAADPPVRAPSRANSTSSRSALLDAGSVHAISDHESARSRGTSTASSPGLHPVVKPHVPATCKSALDAVLSKEAVGKIAERSREKVEDDAADDPDLLEDGDDEENDDDNNDDDDAVDGDHRLAIVLEDDEDEEDNDDGDDDDDVDDDDLSDFELDSDDDGYVEDVESDDDASVFDEDLFPNMRTSSQTPTNKLRIDTQRAREVRHRPIGTPVQKPAPPSESDLPDTTDFCAGNLDEDQPACAAFDAACRERAERRRLAKPQDIDPTFPESGSEDDPDDEIEKRLDATITAATARNAAGATTDGVDAVVPARKICRSPPANATKSTRLLHSPPLAARRTEHKTRSLPRRHGFVSTALSAIGTKHGKFPPKPCRAVMIKQSNEQRAQRRREKKERRHAAREAKKARKCPSGNVSAAGGVGGTVGLGNGTTGGTAGPVTAVDTLGHIKMQAIGTKKLTAAKSTNPCEFRPMHSI